MFRLDEEGIVVGKEFEQSYRVRPSPDLLVERAVGESSRVLRAMQQVDRNGIVIRAGVDNASVRPYEKHEVRVILDLPPGIHVYGSPLPSGYVPLAISVSSFDGLDIEPCRLPKPSPLRMDGIDEALPAYVGRVEARAEFNIVPFLETATLTVVVSYQACTESLCYPAESVSLDVALKGADLIRD
jgi:Disulphide bond corrector protein DsbC